MTTSSLKISDLKPNQAVEMLLLVRRKNLARSRNGRDYLNLKLGDRSGEITAFLWDGAEAADAAVSEGDCVLVRGRTQIFNNALQLTVNALEPWTGEVDPRRFLPHTEQHIPTMERDLHQLIADLQDPWLRRLVEAFFLRDPEFARKFALAPAAKAMHHAWLGGLLEHTLGVARLAEKVCGLYPGINADLVMAGALLHDIGKIDELVYQRDLDYSTPGRLLGHVMLGVTMVREKAAQIKGFPPQTLMLLEHLILSHHGEYAYGSPKRPKTREAILLNFIDDLDAKLVAVGTFMARSRREDTEWSDYHRLFERNFYLGSDAAPDPGPEDPESAGPEDSSGPGLLF
jgi:3'-5' exoribonuclease